MAPKWVVYLLAGTYWRIWGHPQNGIHCYRRALSTVPPEYEDVVLTNLAGLLYKTGTLDDALLVMKDALAIDDKDPDSNFFIANLYSAKGNMTGALHHYQQALRMNPDYKSAFQFMYVPACQMKFKKPTSKHSRKKQSTCATGGMSAECLNKNSVTKVDGMEAMIFCKDGHCRFVTPEEFVANSDSSVVPVIDSLSIKGQQQDIGQINSSSSKTKKKKPCKKCKKWKKTNKKKAVIIPKEGEQTMLLNQEQLQKKALPQGAVEIGTIAENEVDELEDDPEDDEDGDDDETEIEVMIVDTEDQVVKSTSSSFIGPFHLVDDPLPDVMIKVREKLVTPPPTKDECTDSKTVNWAAFTSTWLSVSAKNIDIREFLGDYLEPLPEGVSLKPYCEETPTSLLSMDHLVGVRMRDHLHIAAESGLRDAFQSLAGEKMPVDVMASRITRQLHTNSTSWVMSTAAALYWRVKGQTTQAVNCLRHALYHAPRPMKDIPLISLANILHRAGLYNDALIATNMALEISPKFVVIHFTMANIYASKVNILLKSRQS